MVDKKLLDKVYNNYKKKTTNMSFSEFLKWSNNSCSKKASLDRRPIKRNLLLLGTPKEAWTNWHIKEAQKQIGFEKRHRIGKAGKPVKDCNISKRTIARKNWAYNPNK